MEQSVDRDSKRSVMAGRVRGEGQWKKKNPAKSKKIRERKGRAWEVWRESSGFPIMGRNYLFLEGFCVVKSGTRWGDAK